MAEKVKINPSIVKKQILEEGMTRKQLSDHYGISMAQVNKFLELTKMSDLRAKRVTFEIVNTLEPQIVDREEIDEVVESIQSENDELVYRAEGNSNHHISY